jgi:4-hydroxybenzoate polyprenyltransferase
MVAMIRKIYLVLDNIRFEHTIFALPFAYLGTILALRGLPTLGQFVWITLAMASARTLAMSVNRLVDRELDARNPRTWNRPLPRGTLRPWEVTATAIVSGVLLLVSAWQLNDLCVKLAPFAMMILIGYPYVKRFSWLSHWVLGLADGLAPLGGWLAVRPEVTPAALVLTFAVATWVAGFDLIYACQDVDVDRRDGLYSVAANFGVATALRVSTMMHGFTLLALAGVGLLLVLGPLYYLGWAAAAFLLAYEHRIISPNDLSRLNAAFFNVNGYIAIIVFISTTLDLLGMPRP